LYRTILAANSGIRRTRVTLQPCNPDLAIGASDADATAQLVRKRLPVGRPPPAAASGRPSTLSGALLQFYSICEMLQEPSSPLAERTVCAAGGPSLLGCLTKIVPINFGGIEPCNWPAALPVAEGTAKVSVEPVSEVRWSSQAVEPTCNDHLTRSPTCCRVAQGNLSGRAGLCGA